MKLLVALALIVWQVFHSLLNGFKLVFEDRVRNIVVGHALSLGGHRRFAAGNEKAPLSRGNEAPKTDSGTVREAGS